MSLIDIDQFNYYVDQKLITKRCHPKIDLVIWNYTQKAQYNKIWDDVTINSRGLITDSNGFVKYRPFKKFFNYGEYQGEIPGSFRIAEKFDGSLGIMYYDGSKYALATRGSFESDQALKGTDLLNRYIDLYGESWIEEGVTNLFEIIYPDNRIVVDYGEEEKLVLLGRIKTVSGEELDFSNIELPHIAYLQQSNHSIAELPKKENSEGYVLSFDTGLKLKIKHDEYVRLHRIVTQITTYTVWEMLKNGDSFDDALERVPDEFFDWLTENIKKLQNQYNIIEQQGKSIYEKIKDIPTRKDQALKIKDQPKVIQSVCFSLLDGKDYSQAIYKAIKPEYEKPFKKDIDS